MAQLAPQPQGVRSETVQGLALRNYFCTIFKNIYICSPLWEGELAEWLMAAVLKTVDPKGFGGSNPSLTAKRNKKSVTSLLVHAFFMTVCKPRRWRGGNAQGAQRPSTIPESEEFQILFYIFEYEKVIPSPFVQHTCRQLQPVNEFGQTSRQRKSIGPLGP